jgi:hypothetical protein
MFRWRPIGLAGLKGANRRNENPLMAGACTEYSTEKPIEKQPWKAADKPRKNIFSKALGKSR